jgi:hypothetical protein
MLEMIHVEADPRDRGHVTFASGLALGLMLKSEPSPANTAQKTSSSSSSRFFSDAQAQDREQANSLLSDRIRELEKQLADSKQDQHLVLTDRLAFFKKYHAQVSLQPFDQDMKVTPEMAALLDLSPEEKRAVEAHLAEMKNQLGKLQDADTVLSKQTANSVSYDIAADKEGDTLKDKLHGLLVGDIGDDRAEVLMGGNPYVFNSQLAGFMESKEQIEISWTQPANPSTYTVRQNQFNSNGAPTGSSSISGSLQPEFQKYLPDGAKP